jgi:hypothetical protein
MQRSARDHLAKMLGERPSFQEQMLSATSSAPELAKRARTQGVINEHAQKLPARAGRRYICILTLAEEEADGLDVALAHVMKLEYIGLERIHNTLRCSFLGTRTHPHPKPPSPPRPHARRQVTPAARRLQQTGEQQQFYLQERPPLPRFSKFVPRKGWLK